MECYLPNQGDEGSLTCPLVYCPPDPSEENAGDFTFSICIATRNTDSDSRTWYCQRDRVCDHAKNCETIAATGRQLFFNEPSNNTKYYTVGCKEGNYTNNESFKFPAVDKWAISSSDVRITESMSSSIKIENTLMMSWILMLVLVYTFVQKKL